MNTDDHLARSYAQWRREIAQQVRDGLITQDEANEHLERIAEREASESKKGGKQ